MSWPPPGNKTVTVIRRYPAGFDRYGDPEPTLDTRETVEGCALAPRVGGETDAPGRSGVIDSFTLYLPAEVRLRWLDQVELTEDLVAEPGIYEVDGEPGIWASPYTDDVPGSQVALRRASG